MHVTFLMKKKSWTRIWRGGNVRSHKAAQDYPSIFNNIET